MAAGTVVIRERSTKVPLPVQSPPISSIYQRLDVTAVTAEEIALIRRYFERREALPEAASAGTGVGYRPPHQCQSCIARRAVDPEGFLARVLTDKGR